MKIAFVYAGGRLARLDAVRAGQSPAEFFYGAIELAGGHDVGFFDAPSRPSPLASVWDLALRHAGPARLRGEHLLAVWPLRWTLADYDVVVATSTAHALALGLLHNVGLIRPHVVGIHCGLVNFPIEGVRREATRWALRDQPCVVFAEPERGEMLAQLGLAPGAVTTNAFGVDVDFWTPGEARDDGFLLAVGNDARRDYTTLLEAVRDENVPVKIITARPLPELPPHVEHLRGTWHRPAVSDEELRDLYRRSLAVVVPLEDSIQPSGQSVALQAMACGKPVVMSKTSGLWTGNDFAAERDLLLVEAGRSDDLRRKLQMLRKDRSLREQLGRSARDSVERRGTIREFARNLSDLCERR